MIQLFAEDYPGGFFRAQCANILGQSDAAFGVTQVERIAVVGDLAIFQCLLQIQGVIAFAAGNYIETTVVAESVITGAPLKIIVAGAALD
ncbi:hypothetical protein D3C81_1657160 [compost metagenome]